MGGHEVLQYVQTLTEIRLNRQLDGTSRRIRHQSAHTRKLLDLLVGTAGSGIRHHEDIIIFVKSGQQRFCQRVVRCFPCFYNFFITLFFRNQTTLKVLRDLIHRILSLFDHLRLLRRHGHIGDRYGHSRSGGIFISDGFYRIQHLRRSSRTMGINYLLKNLF